MEMLKSIMLTITGMGATAILPLVIFILGLVFRMKVGAAIKSGITVGIGFIGLGLVVNLLSTSLQPAIAYYSKIGSGFTVAQRHGLHLLRLWLCLSVSFLTCFLFA